MKIAAVLALLPAPLRTPALQMSRYATAGIVITFGVAASYWALAELAGFDPMLSFTVVFLLFWVISYFTHSGFSFKGHGARDRQHIRASRYLAVTLFGFSLNQFWVWLLVKYLGGATWWPTLPMIFLTPLVLFMLMRRFVFS